MLFRSLYLKDLDIEVPCGRCIPCRVQRSRMWVVRCLHEASYYKSNVFITLTYNDSNLPVTLSKRHMQLFVKRLRKLLGYKIKYFIGGEYGDKTYRPHYHGILFGVGYDSFSPIRIGSKVYYRTPAWTLGNIYLGTVTGDSIRYCADYILKSNFDIDMRQIYVDNDMLPPFSLKSLGIGKRYA